MSACAIAEGVTLDWQELVALCYEVAEKTSENYSSMNRDVHFKRLTEIAFINGYIDKIAKKHQLNVPINQQLLAQISELPAYQHINKT